MTPEDLAALHARCFDSPRPWSADEIASLLAGRGTFLLEAPHGFLMGRAIAGEAELLTVAVDPQARRAEQAETAEPPGCSATAVWADTVVPACWGVRRAGSAATAARAVC